MTRRRVIVLALTLVLLSFVVGCAPVGPQPSALASASSQASRPARDGAVRIPTGTPVAVRALHYTQLFAEKPFAEALMIYGSNGSYEIVSPGEDHFGSYVADGDVRDSPSMVTFLSWPDADWGDNVAWHTLTFDADTGDFDQVLRLPGDETAHHEAGLSTSVDVSRLGTSRDWATLRDRFSAAFDALADRAT